MATRSAAVGQNEKTDFDSLFVPPERIHEEMRGVFDQIARRAYELFENRGGFHGQDQDDWYRAESTVLEPVRHEASDAGDAFVVLLDVSSVELNDLCVSAEPQSLRVLGASVASNTPADGLRETVPSSRVFYLSYKLPSPIDPKKVSAQVRNDLLEIRLPKPAERQEEMN
jgi:HSP20 family protein